MCESINTILKRFNLTKEDISLVIPHQANLRIINGVAKGMGMPPEKFFVNIEKYGNMSAVCIPVALMKHQGKGLLKRAILWLLWLWRRAYLGANLIKWTK